MDGVIALLVILALNLIQYQDRPARRVRFMEGR